MEKVMIELIIGSQVNRLHDDKKKQPSRVYKWKRI